MVERTVMLRKKLLELNLDAFLVTNKENIYYLSGFSGDDGILLVTLDNQYLITDHRFEFQVGVQAPDWDVKMTRNYFKTALDLAKKEHCVALGFEDDISFYEYDFMDENSEVDIVQTSNIILLLRSFKDEDEIFKIKKSCRLAKRGYMEILNSIKPNQSETDVALNLDYFMKKNGAEKESFETIIASGEKTTWAHGVASSKKIKRTDMVTVDFGYFLDRYTSDVTRSFAMGTQSDDVKRIYEIVLMANQKTIEAVKAGISAKHLDEVGRNYITKMGYGKYFIHGMGHGIGLSIHELPNVNGRTDECILKNQVITVEPGIYVPGVCGVRIEDDILVTEDGYENLTDFGHDYLELGF